MSYINRISTKDMSEQQWLDYRQSGLGGSDIATLLGISPYKTPLELHLEKIGEYEPFVKPNRFIGFGNLHEPEIANLYQYWDGDADEMFNNLKEGKKTNNVRSVFAYITNSKYPQLFSSIDRMILSDGKKGRGVLECKNISSYRLKAYTDDIPYEHIVQLISYLMVTEYEHGALAMEVDGNDFKVYEFNRSDAFVQEIMEKIEKLSHQFWMNVLKARMLKEEYDITNYYNIHPDQLEDPKIQKAVAELQELEPAATPDKSLDEFLNKIFKVAPITIEGTDELWQLAVHYNQAKENENLAKSDKLVNAVKIKTIMKNTEKADFGEQGSILWKANIKGARRLSINLKN